MPEQYGDLAGVEIHACRSVTRDLVHVWLRQKLPTRQLAASFTVPGPLLSDELALRTHLAVTADRMFRPWRYPDANPMPEFVLFPRLQRWFKRC